MNRWLKVSAVLGVVCSLVGIGVITLGGIMGGFMQLGSIMSRFYG